MWKLALVFLIPILIEGATTRRPVGKVPLNEKQKASSEEDVEFDGEWECGGEDFSKLISQQMISKDCPQLLHPVNNCCLGHDRCYEQQQGQAHCDKVFCGCLDKITYSADNSTQICHEEHSLYFCGLVQEFGDSFYNASVNKTENSEDGKKTSTLIRTTINKTEAQTPVRIYESKNQEVKTAIEGLPTLETLN